MPPRAKLGRPKKKATAPKRTGADAALTAAQETRYTLMRRHGVNCQTIADALKKKRITLTRQTVNGTVRNRSVNEDVIAMFCKLTGATRKEAWPDVPEKS